MATRWVREWSLSQTALAGLLLVAVLAVWVGFGVFESHNRAQALSRATGQRVTTWQALWLDLTVPKNPATK